MAQTTKDWPLRQSPAAKTLSTLVLYLKVKSSWNSGLQSSSMFEVLPSGFYIASPISINFELSKNSIFRSKESHGQKNQLARIDLFRVWYFCHFPPSIHFCPFNQSCFDATDMTVVINEKFFALGIESSWIISMFYNDFFMSIINLISKFWESNFKYLISLWHKNSLVL